MQPNTCGAKYPGVPASVVKRLNAELNAVAVSTDTREVLARFAAVPTFGTAADYGQANTSEIARWSKLISDSSIKVE